MVKGIRTKLAALGLGTIVLLGISGCDLGGTVPTPVVNPTNTAPAPTAITAPTVTTIEAPSPTSAPTTEPTTPATEVPVEKATPTEAPVSGVTPSVRQAVRFADYKLEVSSVSPSLKPYSVKADLSNVSNAKDFQFSPAGKSLLASNAFVAQFPTGDQYKQFFQLYEDGRYSEKPVFVSTDSVLHVYHLMFDKVLRSTETKYLISKLKTLTSAMLATSQAQYDGLKGTSAESAAKRNVAYFAVAASLLDPGATVPASVQNEVAQELKLIEEHGGVSPSVIMNMGGANAPDDVFMEDYGQYNPRGHYTRSEELQRYFKAMMWYGRITFRLNNVDETRSALLLTQALQSATGPNGSSASAAWAGIYEPTSFFVGGADDLTYKDYAPIMEQALGGSTDVKAVADDAKIARFQQLARSLAGPRINSMFVYIWQDKDQVTKGLRMMGQRFTLDEYLFGQLIWRNVGDPNDDTKKRWLPRALDIPTALGSQEAYNLLDQTGETQYVHYPQQIEKVRGEVASLPQSQWTENLYWSWLYTFRPLLAPKAKESGYPSFMTNDAWTRKDLNTVMGSWTELKHDTLLYAKQVMAEMGGGPEQLPKGYVELEPEFYARVAALVAMTRDGLLSRGLIEKSDDTGTQTDFGALNDLESLALDLKRISEKELTGKALTQAEYELIKFYGGRLEDITRAAADPVGEQGGDLNDQDAAIVADVATGKDQAVEEGTGRIREVYVVAPVEGKLVLTRGGIYSQYEFVQPSGNRLMDKQWRQRLDKGQTPPMSGWKTYISK